MQNHFAQCLHVTKQLQKTLENSDLGETLSMIILNYKMKTFHGTSSQSQMTNLITSTKIWFQSNN